MSGGRKRGQQSKRRRERRISIRAVMRDPIDLNKLSRALIAMAQADAEAAARREHEATNKPAHKSEPARSEASADD